MFRPQDVLVPFFRGETLTNGQVAGAVRHATEGLASSSSSSSSEGEARAQHPSLDRSRNPLASSDSDSDDDASNRYQMVVNRLNSVPDASEGLVGSALRKRIDNPDGINGINGINIKPEEQPRSETSKDKLHFNHFDGYH